MENEVASSKRSTESYKGLPLTARIAKAGKVLFSAYRQDQFADGQLFAVQLGMLFEKYDIEAVEWLVNIQNENSLQRRFKFPPSLAEITDALNEEKKRRVTMRGKAERDKQERNRQNRPYVRKPQIPGCRANVLVPKDNDKYGALCEWAKKADECDYEFTDCGIRVALSVWEDQMGVILASRWRSLSDADLRAQYGRQEAEASKAR